MLEIKVVDTDELIIAAGRALDRAESLEQNKGMLELTNPHALLRGYAENLLRCAAYIRHLEKLAFGKDENV